MQAIKKEMQQQEEEEEEEENLDRKIVMYYDHASVDNEVDQHFARALSSKSPSKSKSRFLFPPSAGHSDLDAQASGGSGESTTSSPLNTCPETTNPRSSGHFGSTKLQQETNLSSESVAVVPFSSLSSLSYSSSHHAWNDKEDTGNVDASRKQVLVNADMLAFSVQPEIDTFSDIPRVPGESRKGECLNIALPPPQHLLDNCSSGNWEKTNYKRFTCSNSAATFPASSSTASSYLPISPQGHQLSASRYSLSQLTPSPSPNINAPSSQFNFHNTAIIPTPLQPTPDLHYQDPNLSLETYGGGRYPNNTSQYPNISPTFPTASISPYTVMTPYQPPGFQYPLPTDPTYLQANSSSMPYYQPHQQQSYQIPPSASNLPMPMPPSYPLAPTSSLPGLSPNMSSLSPSLYGPPIEQQWNHGNPQFSNEY